MDNLDKTKRVYNYSCRGSKGVIGRDVKDSRFWVLYVDGKHEGNYFQKFGAVDDFFEIAVKNSQKELS